MSVSVIAALVVLFAAVFAGIASSRAAEKKVAELRARGLYPEKGKASEADVRRLLTAGNKIMAIRCYREMTGLGLKEAKAAVEKMESAGRA